jgi:hypothetical protein
VSLDVEVVVAGPLGDLMLSVLRSLLLGVEVEPATDTVLVERSNAGAGGSCQDKPADAADVALAVDRSDRSVDWWRVTALPTGTSDAPPDGEVWAS